MIIALVLYNICFVLLLKGVPHWLEIVLCIVSPMLSLAAALIWEFAKSKIELIEKRLDEMDKRR